MEACFTLQSVAVTGSLFLTLFVTANCNKQLAYFQQQTISTNSVAARSRESVRRRSVGGTAGSNRAGHGCLSVCRECCVLSSKDLCDGPITRPDESYRVCLSLTVIRCSNNHA